MTPLRIAARLDYATLEELEVGFADRLGERALFLAHGSIGALSEEPRVGSSVVLEITTASGEPALTLDGVIAWSYAPPQVPPGREAGTGIVIDRFHEGSEALASRIRKRSGAGTRVRAPGTRLKPPAVERARPVTLAPRPLPASLLQLDPTPTAPPTAPPNAPSEPTRSVPAPRLMGLALDQSFDPTPAPGPMPLARELPGDELPAPVGPPRPPSSPIVSLDALPDLPAAVAATAFEQVPTDVDLLRSVDDADVLPDDAPRNFEHRALVDVTGPRLAVRAPYEVDDGAAPPYAALARTESELRLDDGGTDAGTDDDDDDDRAAEPELVSDEDVSPVDEDSTGSHGVSTSALPSVDAADFQTAEHQAIPPSRPSPVAADWEGRTEHGLDPSEPTAEASDPDRTALPARPLPDPSQWPEEEEPTRRPIGVAFMVARRSHQPVGLEVLTWPERGTKRVGALDEAREQGGDKLDEAIASAAWLARDASAGDAALRDTAESFDAGLTDPGRHVVDVVGAMVRASESEQDGGDVFSDSGPPEPSHATSNPALDEQTVAEDVAEEGAGELEESAAVAPEGLEAAATLAGDETVDGVLGAPPLLADDDQETDRDLRRPPTDASPAAKSRLGVLQRFLGKR